MVGNISHRYVHNLHYLPSYTGWKFQRDLQLVFEVQLRHSNAHTKEIKKWLL